MIESVRQIDSTHYVLCGFTTPKVVPNKTYAPLSALCRVTCDLLKRWEEHWDELLYTWIVHHPADFAFLAQPSLGQLRHCSACYSTHVSYSL
jgi:hypothetical protein